MLDDKDEFTKFAHFTGWSVSSLKDFRRESVRRLDEKDFVIHTMAKPLVLEEANLRLWVASIDEELLDRGICKNCWLMRCVCGELTL